MVREQIDALRAGMRRRGALDALSPALDRAVDLDKTRRDTIQAVEERKAARNVVTQQVGQRKRAGEAADDLQQRSRELGDEIARLDRELAEFPLAGFIFRLGLRRLSSSAKASR